MARVARDREPRRGLTAGAAYGWLNRQPAPRVIWDHVDRKNRKAVGLRVRRPIGASCKAAHAAATGFGGHMGAFHGKVKRLRVKPSRRACNRALAGHVGDIRFGRVG